MNFILDIFVVTIIVIFIVISAKKGFVKTIIEFVGLLAALYLALTLSSPLADFTYEKAIEPTVTATINSAVENLGESAEITVKETIYNSLPKFISNNIDFSNFNIGTEENSANEICANLFKPISISFLKAIFTLVLFIILYIFVKFLANMLNKIFSFSIIGTANRLLGGVLGFIKGIIFAVIFVIITEIVISLTGGFFVFTETAVDSSVIFSYLAKILPSSFLI